VNTNKESNSLNQKIVYDLTPFTHLDYADHLAAIIWMGGCNMRCNYCYNKDIVFTKQSQFSLNDMLVFLEKRIGLLDGVVLSGGEVTLHPQVVPFCQIIKKFRFKIKLDTNGSNPLLLQQLLKLNLLDFVALDYKAPKEKFFSITHSKLYDKFSQSLNLLLKSDIDFEVRTTIHNDLLDENDINTIITDLHNRGYDKTYYLQNFLPTEDNIGNISKTTKEFNNSLLLDTLNIVWR